MKPESRIAKFAAEAAATFVLVFCGTGAITANEASSGAVTHVGISLVFGFSVLAMIYSVGHISGAHMNPAVSLAFAACRRLPFSELPGYWLAQLTGGLAASAAVNAIFPNSLTLGATQPSDGLAQSFLLELILTGILMFVIMGVAHDERAESEMAGIAIGGTVALAALLGGPISGASMNPVRSAAPAIVSGNLNGIWIYLLAPTIGALAGGWGYQLVSCRNTPENGNDRCC